MSGSETFGDISIAPIGLFTTLIVSTSGCSRRALEQARYTTQPDEIEAAFAATEAESAAETDSTDAVATVPDTEAEVAEAGKPLKRRMRPNVREFIVVSFAHQFWFPSISHTRRRIFP